MTELSLELKESYDDNLLGVSGDGMPKSYSWITTITPRIGLDLAPLIITSACCRSCPELRACVCNVFPGIGRKQHRAPDFK